jgi:hypothetical protein
MFVLTPADGLCLVYILSCVGSVQCFSWKKIFVGTHLTLVLCSMVSRQRHRWQVSITYS